MSNLSELITNVNEADHTALNIFGAAIGTIADFSGGIGLAQTAIQLISNLVSPDRTQQLLQEILSKIDAGFAKLGLHLKGENILARLRSLHSITDPADGVYTELSFNINGNVSNDFKHGEIEKCVTALQGLMHPELEQWKVVHDDQVFYSPEATIHYGGGGASNSVFTFTPTTPGSVECEGMIFTSNFDPGADTDNLVFNYTYILPAFMRLIMIFLAVCAAFDPNYTNLDNQGRFIRQLAIFLLAIHDKIKAGIVHIDAPDASSMIDPDLDPPFGVVDQNNGFVIQNLSHFFVHTRWTSGYVIPVTPQPYGAVNLFSGHASTGSYPLLEVPPGTFTLVDGFMHRSLPDDFLVPPVSKYLLRTLARSKAVYREIGLPAVRNTINRLRSLVGDPLLDGVSYGDWSVLEVLKVLGHPQNMFINSPENPSFTLSVGDLARYLSNSNPSFDASRPISLRKMLEELPPDLPGDIHH